MLFVIAAVTVTREEALWAEEVARVVDAAPSFAPAAREMVRQVLTSLVSDVTIDPAGRRDASLMFELVTRPRLMQAAV
jgi:hypothetical protein